MKALKWGMAWLVLAAIVAAGLFYAAIHWRPSADRYPVQGITITAEQGEVHWPTLHAAGADFAYILATDGDTGRDPAFANNWAGARDAGMRYGAIHIWQLCRLAPDQATNFIANVPADEAALPPAVILRFKGNCADRPDVDVMISELATFLAMIEAHSENPALLYVTGDFDAAYGITSRVERSFWLQRRLFKPDYGAAPWVMWEATDILRVEGVENPARWNVVRPGPPG
ncbi:MAG: glycoside hydrolase family 25 [Sphingomonadaceae bacterium]|nr:glycoside hydrolase family 25 [Sphingomonadaceae bacterium]